MPGIDPSVITHRLNVYPSSKPVQQKKRVFAPERDNAIKEEVQKLTVAKFIREVYYPDWLANVVMVKKANSKWGTCVNVWRALKVAVCFAFHVLPFFFFFSFFFFNSTTTFD